MAGARQRAFFPILLVWILGSWIASLPQPVKAQQPTGAEARPLDELCESIRIESGGSEEWGVDCRVTLRAGGFAAITVRTNDGVGAEETRLLISQMVGDGHRVLRFAALEINTGGSHSSLGRWVRSRSLGRGTFLFELEMARWFSYPHSPTQSEERERAVVICERRAERCSRPIAVAAWGATTVSGYDWAALGEDWWTRRLRPGEGDFMVTTSVSVPRPGVARLRLRSGSWSELRSGDPRWIDAPRTAAGRTRDVRFALRDPLQATPTVGEVTTVNGTRQVLSSFSTRGDFPAICSQFAPGELRCALQELSEERLALLVRSRDRVMAFLAKREGGELRLLARMVDRYEPSQEGLGVIRSWQRSRLSARFDGFVYEDAGPNERRRYLLVCERASERCVARVPLRRELEERDDPGEPWGIVSQTEAEVRGDVLVIRRISGGWSELVDLADEPMYDGAEPSRPPEDVYEIRLELPPREPPEPPW